MDISPVSPLARPSPRQNSEAPPPPTNKRPDPPSSPQVPRREEYEPYDPLATRSIGEAMALRPYKPQYIDSISCGVQEMVPAARRLWMDCSSMNAFTSHLVGDTMHVTMQAIALRERVQETSREYAQS
ncbi:uncharacterized protein LOC116021738 [Ipomoea triloba]|uniref:uncharacterized protein LOC116021738 n=1 Tax=Ipomoea triloba TaxID=35885 RepID=UPI00125CE5F1|nr:uncharacterized protein LOC116021738 [Ipomoea triloba]